MPATEGPGDVVELAGAAQNLANATHAAYLTGRPAERAIARTLLNQHPARAGGGVESILRGWACGVIDPGGNQEDAANLIHDDDPARTANAPGALGSLPVPAVGFGGSPG